MTDIPSDMPPSPEGVIPPANPKDDEKDKAELLRLSASVNAQYVNTVVNYVNSYHEIAKSIHYGV